MILLLVSVTLVLGYFPGMFQPFEEDVSNEEEAMATNLGAELVENSTVDGTRQTVDFAELDRTMGELVGDSEQVGIPDWMRWNATVVDADGETISHAGGAELQNGTVWHGEETASTVRFVSAQDNDECADGCQLIVRVW